MKAKNFLITEEGQNFINLSEKLRGSLETKLDELSENHEFRLYFTNGDDLLATCDDDEQLIQNIIGVKNDNKVFARWAYIAVKTWYGMYYDDRISVLEKFYNYGKLLSYKNDLLSTVDISLIFSKVLFAELAGILNEIRWRPIRSYSWWTYKVNIQQR